MSSRIIIGGRVIGSGKYGGDPRCLCGQPVAELGRCVDCHAALQRRRRGLPPKTDAERARLAGFLEKYEARASQCAGCGAGIDDKHDDRCAYKDL